MAYWRGRELPEHVVGAFLLPRRRAADKRTALLACRVILALSKDGVPEAEQLQQNPTFLRRSP